MDINLSTYINNGEVVESEYTLALKANARKRLRVQIPPSPFKKGVNMKKVESYLFINGVHLFSAYLRNKKTGTRARIYCKAKYSHDAHSKLKKMYGQDFFITQVEHMSVDKIVRAAIKHLSV